ncbi:MAG: 2,3-bisphosphoglycerate-independent phosphoglycerate mutase [Candidatus Micrarchaeota archaeon]|nr:2,3-bisphosphoglycerate-independent phosphoglycerate mutase [Candidatus Micrarchaeota archaeon]
MKSLLMIMDGIGDIRDGNRPTPLEAARKPNIDRLAKEGSLGLMHTLGRGVKPGSDTAHLAIFGYDIFSEYPGRGPFEALGTEGIHLMPGDIAFRANFATVDKKMKITDRRAGRIESASAKKLEKYINGMEIEKTKVIFKQTTEHRGVLVLRGDRLSGRVSDTDPHETGAMIKSSEHLDTSAEAKKTARIMNILTNEVHKKLSNAPENLERIKKGLHPANMILCRGGGEYFKVEKFEDRHGIKAACVAGGSLYKGVAAFIGMDVVHVSGATGDRYSDYFSKARAAVQASKDHDLVFLHVKAGDSFGHDGDHDGKKSTIEKVDKDIIPMVSDNFDLIVITADHSTPCMIKGHSGHPVPILAYGKLVRKDGCVNFNEYEAAKGSIGQIVGEDLMQLMLNWMDKNNKIGE